MQVSVARMDQARTKHHVLVIYAIVSILTGFFLIFIYTWSRWLNSLPYFDPEVESVVQKLLFQCSSFLFQTQGKQQRILEMQQDQ